MIIPRRHAVSFFAVTEAEQQRLLTLLDCVRSSLNTEVNPASFDIGINEKTSRTCLRMQLADPPRETRDAAARSSSHHDRCALCGVRIATPENQTALDAAHIVPWSVSRYDDVRKGIALSELCLRAFDLGVGERIERVHSLAVSDPVARNEC